MKKFNPTKLLFGFLGLATFASLVGSVSGSLAWYSYSTRASLSYTGTSVERTAQLQIGIVSPNAISYSASEMVEDTTITDAQGNHYYFAPIGSGLTTSILNKYLIANDYATNYLIPVTSGAYAQGDAFSLKKSPNIDTGKINNDAAAPKENYAFFQFIFRIPKAAYSTVTEYLPDREIWLTDAVAKRSFAGNGDVYEALRVYVDRDDTDYGYDYIFNPVAPSAGATKVGGLLDIDRNGYYDYDANNNEIIFGEYDQTVAPSKITSNYQDSDEMIDVNGSEALEPDTFTAKHLNGINYYTSEKLAECDIKTAAYKSLANVAPERNAVTGYLQNANSADPTSLCKTKASDNNLARVNMTVYLEGWDFSVIDNEIGHLFDIGLTFEINKVSAND